MVTDGTPEDGPVDAVPDLFSDDDEFYASLLDRYSEKETKSSEPEPDVEPELDVAPESVTVVPFDDDEFFANLVSGPTDDLRDNTDSVPVDTESDGVEVVVGSVRVPNDFLQSLMQSAPPNNDDNARSFTRDELAAADAAYLAAFTEEEYESSSLTGSLVSEVVVPDVHGMRTPDAVAEISAIGVDVAVRALSEDEITPDDFDDSGAVVRGVVVRQEPPAGEPVPDTQVVTLWEHRDLTVSSSQVSGSRSNRMLMIGSVIALIVLSLGMLVAAIFMNRKDSAPAPQPPPPSPSVSASATPTAPAQLVAVPKLVGLTLDQAKAAVVTSGFAVQEEDRVISNKPAGTILSQTPQAGDQAASGSPIRVTVSGGKTGEKVPSVLGKKRENAVSVLEAAGFKVGSVTVVSDPAPEGTVMSQTPSPDATAPKGATIKITVSDGMREMPDVVGKTKEQAVSDLVALGYTVNVYQQENPGKPANTVFAQTPQAKELTRTGSSVSITVTPPK